jgi:hypothetical protein
VNQPLPVETTFPAHSNKNSGPNIIHTIRDKNSDTDGDCAVDMAQLQKNEETPKRVEQKNLALERTQRARHDHQPPPFVMKSVR